MVGPEQVQVEVRRIEENGRPVTYVTAKLLQCHRIALADYELARFAGGDLIEVTKEEVTRRLLLEVNRHHELRPLVDALVYTTNALIAANKSAAHASRYDYMSSVMLVRTCQDNYDRALSALYRAIRGD